MFCSSSENGGRRFRRSLLLGKEKELFWARWGSLSLFSRLQWDGSHFSFPHYPNPQSREGHIAEPFNSESSYFMNVFLKWGKYVRNRYKFHGYKLQEIIFSLLTAVWELYVFFKIPVYVTAVFPTDVKISWILRFHIISLCCFGHLRWNSPTLMTKNSINFW